MEYKESYDGVLYLWNHPLPIGEYTGEIIGKIELISWTNSVMDGQHGISMQFTNKETNDIIIRRTTIESLRFLHEIATMENKCIKPFSFESELKGIDILNPDLIYISNGESGNLIHHLSII